MAFWFCSLSAAALSLYLALASSIWRRASLTTHIELQLFALSAESGKADRGGTAAGYYRGYKHLPLNSRVLTAVPTLAPGLWLGQNDHHRWPSKIFSSKSGVVNPPNQGCHQVNRSPASAPGFYSTYFLVTKKEGGLWPILDLRGLNRFLKVMPFHMLSTTDILRVIGQKSGSHP